MSRIHVQGQQLGVKQPNASNVPQGEQMGRGMAHGQSVGQGGDLKGNPSPEYRVKEIVADGFLLTTFSLDRGRAMRVLVSYPACFAARF